MGRMKYRIVENEPYYHNLRLEVDLLGGWSYLHYDVDKLVEVGNPSGSFYYKGEVFYKRLATFTLLQSFSPFISPYSLGSIAILSDNELEEFSKFEVGGTLHLSDREVMAKVPVVILEQGGVKATLTIDAEIRRILGLRGGYFTTGSPIMFADGKSFTAADGTFLSGQAIWSRDLGTTIDGRYNTNITARGFYAGIGQTEFTNLTIKLDDGKTYEKVTVEQVFIDFLYADVEVDEILQGDDAYDIQGEGSEGLEVSKYGWRIYVEFDGSWATRYGIEIGKRPGYAGDYYAELKVGMGLSLSLASLK